MQMLKENEDVISFVPGKMLGAKPATGKIVIHDRITVESDILPKYFNHASFASLRRQLNYFHFVRVGKGRQRGAVYENDAVFELEDILRLKRRAIGNIQGASEPSPRTTATVDSSNGNSKANEGLAHRPTVVSPLPLSPHVSDEGRYLSETEHEVANDSFTERWLSKTKARSPRIVLDLTRPPEATQESQLGSLNFGHIFPRLHDANPFQKNHATVPINSFPSAAPSTLNDAEVLEGCNALLSLIKHV